MTEATIKELSRLVEAAAALAQVTDPDEQVIVEVALSDARLALDLAALRLRVLPTELKADQQPLTKAIFIGIGRKTAQNQACTSVQSSEQ